MFRSLSIDSVGFSMSNQGHAKLYEISCLDLDYVGLVH